MNEMTAELGKRLAERWMSLLVLPGVLFLSTLTVAAMLGHRAVADVQTLANSLTIYITRYVGTPKHLAIALVAILLAAAIVGTTAQSLGCAVRRTWLAAGPDWATRAAINRRRARWHKADRFYQVACEEGADDVTRARLAERRNVVALCEPGRPTWIGDRIRATGVRVFGQYRFDFAFAWPRLWLLFPDSVRAELRSANDAHQAAATLVAWGILYIAVGLIWWPAIAGGLGAMIVGWWQGRSTAERLAALMESSVDLHSADLAEALGIDVKGRLLTPREGSLVDDRLRKGA